MNCDDFTLTIDDYVDGTADAADATALEHHLSGCPSCRSMVADFRAIRMAARTLPPLEPPARVWHAVAARIEAPGARQATAPWLPPSNWGWQPLAAAAMLAVVVSGLTWVGGRLGTRPAPATASVARAAAETGTDAVDDFQTAEALYADAIASLEAETAAAGPAALDVVTAAALQGGLEAIDEVIGDTRQALAREPDDELSQESLLDALGSKVALLQDTVALIHDRNGLDEGFNQ